MADETIEGEVDTGMRNEETRETLYVNIEIPRIMSQAGLEQITVS